MFSYRPRKRPYGREDDTESVTSLGRSWAWKVVVVGILIAAIGAGVGIEAQIAADKTPEFPNDFPNDLYGYVLMTILMFALCLGFALYLVYPRALQMSKEVPKGKAVSRADLLLDDQDRLDDYMAGTSGKGDSLVYSMLLYQHSAAGDRANGAERGSRIALGFAVAALITIQLDNHFLIWVLVFLGTTALTNSMVWGPSFVRWLRNEDRA